MCCGMMVFYYILFHELSFMNLYFVELFEEMIQGSIKNRFGTRYKLENFFSNKIPILMLCIVMLRLLYIQMPNLNGMLVFRKYLIM